MTTRAVADVIAELEEGDEVRLELADGRVIEGTFRGSKDGEVELADEGAFDVTEVADVGKWVSTEGPE